jgi:hypothetical protein
MCATGWGVRLRPGARGGVGAEWRRRTRMTEDPREEEGVKAEAICRGGQVGDVGASEMRARWAFRGIS